MISGGVPFLTFLPKGIRIPEWFGKPDPFWYGVAALVFVYGAYMAEVYRAGIEAVPKGQMEAARSLGMSHLQSMRHIIVPQAVTKVPAPMLNEMISLLKDTTLVSVIAFGESVLVSPRNPGRTAEQLGADPHRRLLPRHLPAGRAPGRLPDQAQPGQTQPRLPHRGGVMAEPTASAERTSTNASATSKC